MRFVPYPQREQQLQTLQLGWETQHNVSFTPSRTRMKTDYRYPGIKDTQLPGDALLLVLTLVNITFTCTTSRGGSVINARLAGEQNIWLEVELGTLNGDGIQVDVTESAVQPGPGLRCHLSDLQIYFENWPDAQSCTHTHTLGDVIHIYQGREEATNFEKKKSAF